MGSGTIATREGLFITMGIPSSLRQQVILEANHRCEYCQTSSRLTGIPLVMEHILPRSVA